jgi:hypothetical protein
MENVMKRKWLVGVVLVTALAIPAAGWAHTGHAHKYMGTVTTVSATHLEVKTTDGKTVKVVLNAKTALARGKQKVDVAALKAGERVVVEVPNEKDMIASKVTLPALRAAATK